MIDLLDATLDTTYILPGLLRDLVESSRAQRRLQQETITAQRNLIQELSTPIIPISESILIMPLIGVIDDARAQQIMESLWRQHIGYRYRPDSRRCRCLAGRARP